MHTRLLDRPKKNGRFKVADQTWFDGMLCDITKTRITNGLLFVLLLVFFILLLLLDIRFVSENGPQ